MCVTSGLTVPELAQLNINNSVVQSALNIERGLKSYQGIQNVTVFAEALDEQDRRTNKRRRKWVLVDGGEDVRDYVEARTIPVKVVTILSAQRGSFATPDKIWNLEIIVQGT
jgi:hypothetical protein